MKLVLFGGAESGTAYIELKQIEKVIKRLKPKQLLHIPFARTTTSEEEWQGDWFHRNIVLPKGVLYLNYKNKQDIKKIKNPLIFISGGSNKLNLIRRLKKDPKLTKLIRSAACIIGESAGAVVLGSCLSTKSGDMNSKIIRGLGIVPNTLFTPHYTERKRQKFLEYDMERTGVKYGIGIDSLTALEIDTKTFPKKYKKIGLGKVFVFKAVS